jgi:hypothetical protein
MAKQDTVNVDFRELPYFACITLKIDLNGDEMDSPNRFVLPFHTKYKTDTAFKKAVRAAIKDWISENPESFATSVADNGMDDLNVHPDEKGFKTAAKALGANWKMVFYDMPLSIGLRHGFLAMRSDISIAADEYDKA